MKKFYPRLGAEETGLKIIRESRNRNPQWYTDATPGGERENVRLTYNPLTVIHILPHLIFHIAEGLKPQLILRAPYKEMHAHPRMHTPPQMK